MNIRVGQKLILEHNILYQMLGDPFFWEEVPEFLDLKDDGERAHYFAKKNHFTVREISPGCVGCTSIKSTLKPILSEVSSRVALWAESEPEKLENLIIYITKRRGSRPYPIVMYRKDDAGTTYAVEF